MAAANPINVGFLTVLHEANGYVGGYLATNGWGRPLEFRLSTAVQPNRVQQVLYAGTLRSYVCADLIGRTLVEKSSVSVQLVVTDTEAALDLRQRIEVPVIRVADDAVETTFDPALCASPPSEGRGAVLVHPRFASDVPAVREMLAGLEGILDLTEPFARIREAVAEARKLGVTGRG